MPYLFLSPSTQQFNPYVTRENEEYWMNRLADAMEPDLLACGIGVVRNDPDKTAAAAIQQSNAGEFDFHLALHSNAAPPDRAGQVRGIELYYYPTSADGQRMADLLAEQLKTVYPLPELVRTVPTTSLGEVRRTKAPSVLAELGYHDNEEDALWIEENPEAIAAALVRGICAYFGVPYVEPEPVRRGEVTVNWGTLNIRDAPSLAAPVLASAPDGAVLTVYGQSGNWYAVQYHGITGYASTAFIVLLPEA